MRPVKIISGAEFDVKTLSAPADDRGALNSAVNEIIAAVRAEGDAAVRRYASRFEKETPENFEVPLEEAKAAWEDLASGDPDLAGALKLAAANIRRFAEIQKSQLSSFETEMQAGLFAGQRVIPVERAAIYVPGGRYPLVSSALMGLIPAAVAGVSEKILVSPPGSGGLPDKRILAAAHLAGADRIFALGGAQAIAALALGTESIPRADLIVGAGNKYVSAAKRVLFGEVGIDLVAGPTDVLLISDEQLKTAAADMIAEAASLIAADMLAQAEHDPDARARALVPSRELAEQIAAALEEQLALSSTGETARASLEAGGLIIVYSSKEEAVKITASS